MSATAYTSDLSIDEALLLEEVGFKPLDLVMGSSFFHIGYQLAGWKLNQEMEKLTEAMRLARHNAMAGLDVQARRAGADGVVGVRIVVDHREHHAEFVAMGTAVKAPDAGWRVGGLPFTSDLSGQDFWALVRAGQRPRGLVLGTCVYHVAHQSLGAWTQRLGKNCEMPNFTQALYDARELAMERMQAEASRLGATGVVAVHIEESNHGWHPHIIEFLAYGTAIMPSGQAVHEPVAPLLNAR